MFLAFIGIIVALVGFLGYRLSTFTGQFGNVFKLTGIGVMLVGLLSASIIQIEPGDVGVKTLFGQVFPDVLGNGLHMVNPFMDVKRFDIKTQNYTMSGVHDEGDKAGDDAIRALSSDGLEVVIDVTALYSVIPNQTPNILKEIGTDYKNVIVRPITRTKIRDNAVYYQAVDLYSSKRDEFQARIFEGIATDLKKRGMQLEQLLVRNITLPASVKASIEAKINAEQDAQKMQFVLQKERQEAERKRVEAQGIADYQKIVNSGLSDKLLQYEMIKAQKEIALSNNAKVLIMNGGKGSPVIVDTK